MCCYSYILNRCALDECNCIFCPNSRHVVSIIHFIFFRNYIQLIFPLSLSLRQFRNAAASRQLANKSNSPNHLRSVQGGMTEDEALAHALARSIQELDEAHDRNRRNQQQQQQSVPCGGSSSSTSNAASKDKCSLS